VLFIAQHYHFSLKVDRHIVLAATTTTTSTAQPQ
jgi:hypothetical protein